MNLHAIVAPIIAAVNPWISGNLQVSNGSTTAPDGTRVPAYLPTVPVQIQMQSLTYSDIQQLDSLNIAGIRQAMYLNGDVSGLVRSDNKGGDIITLPSTGEVWLVAYVLERWADTAGWVKICATKQVPR